MTSPLGPAPGPAPAAPRPPAAPRGGRAAHRPRGRVLRALLGAACAAPAALALGLGAAPLAPAPAAAQQARIQVDIAFLHIAQEAPPVLSNLDPDPEDLGIAGARRGLQDNAASGRFLGHDYALTEITVAPGEDPGPAIEQALASASLIIADAPADVLLRLADAAAAKGALVFNAAAPDDALRRAECRSNLLHSTPSRAMLADALGQFLAKKRWREIMLIEGAHPKDKAWAEALRRSFAKFGLSLEAEKTWDFDADMRRSAAAEVPLFTQGADVDVYVLADEIGDWARYVPYNTWLPRPIAGSEGLRPAAWAEVVEQWGAAQLHSRFEEDAGRPMRPEDYGAWAAIRSIGEAVTRSNTADAAALRSYILSPKFELAGFLGRKMTYRTWNGQLRQPIPLVHPRALAAQAPLEGFLHQRTELDTLGYDEPEAGCTAFD
ncbi:ABC transporter substrate-binding protein [Rhodovulum sp. DZ06]|uniref:ABC transporter substrate-binding protein n=1 Tax=Rhodovulum sp. DZ06 TaxID=3425126 RepID=UPI003D34BCEC